MATIFTAIVNNKLITIKNIAFSQLRNHRILNIHQTFYATNFGHIFSDSSQSAEPLPEEDDSFELPEDFQPFLQDTPLYTDNTANGMTNQIMITN